MARLCHDVRATVVTAALLAHTVRAAPTLFACSPSFVFVIVIVAVAPSPRRPIVVVLMTISAVGRRALDYAAVRALLPHREPCVLLASVSRNRVAHSLVARTLQSAPDQYHLLEALAQAAAVLLRQMPLYRHRTLPAFAAARRVVWNTHHMAPLPARPLRLHVALRRARQHFGTVRVVAYASHLKVCHAELVFSFLRPCSLENTTAS
ncbi:unnamed protein product [Agarophyton chilense]